MTPRVPETFWRVQRPVVDAARGAISRRQRRSVAPSGGPLTGDTRALTFVQTHPLVQPDRTSCGSSSVTMLRMLRDPAYAAVVLDADDPDAVFGRAALGVRRRTNATVDARGSLQLPWPAALGVRPAAMVRLLEAPDGFGATGRRYRNRVIDPLHAAPVHDEIRASVTAGEPVLLYVGNGHWMQHIVLVVGAAADVLTVYDPAVGHLVDVARSDFLAGTMSVAGWARPWLAILGQGR